ncbi:hypothetical protein [Rhizobium laguerreae]|uniref:hypothetical protein n=1 Tax=Rhizobium laguerreae TaxID=1076926 RepID=UPI0014413B5A|nr:hypothetical protein [Rhizobium laguerreae]MBY3278234.1 hypothetical protein [Rhizobium laguerreae]NKM38558.1 hypothetical protein [Rhizobium laguerreae]NNH84491.1 hypothetical protein [Rhizobium laguerreae]
MDIRYKSALRAGGGIDRPDLAIGVRYLMDNYLPEAWRMLAGSHPIQEIAAEIPGLPPGILEEARVHLRVADWPLDRTSRILRSRCNCGAIHRTIVLNARMLDLFTYVHAKISENVTLGSRGGERTLRFDGDTIEIEAMRTRVVSAQSVKSVAAAIHSCGGENALIYHGILGSGIAFLTAHEAAHAHVLFDDQTQEERWADRIAMTTLQQRATYLLALSKSINGRYDENFDPDLPLFQLFCGVELLLHHLDLERALTHNCTRARMPAGPLSPQQRFADMAGMIDLFIRLQVCGDYWAWRLPYLTFWEAVAAILESPDE